MEPTLPAHSYVLIEVWPPLKPLRGPPRKPLGVGDVVVVNHPSKPIMIIKRVAEISAEGLLDVRSDNRADGTDSRHFGRIDPARVVGRATLSLEWPFRRL